MFRYDSPVIQAIDKIADLLLLGLLTLLLSLTVVCAGPAATALYYAVAKSVRRDRGSAFKNYFHSFRENFRVSMILGIPFAVFFAALAVYDFPAILALFVEGSSVSFGWSILSILKVLVVFGIGSYLFPLISRFQVTVKGALITSLTLAVRCFPVTLILTVILMAAALLVTVVPWTVFLLPGCVSLLHSYFLDPVFRALLPEDSTGDDPWYRE